MAGINMDVRLPTRGCVVKGEPGYFHLWEQWNDVVDAGQVGQVYGIIEFKDGVRRIDPTDIEFCDEENADLCALAKYYEALKKGKQNV